MAFMPILKRINFFIFIGKILASSFETIRLRAGCEYTPTFEAGRKGERRRRRDIHIFTGSFRPVRRQCPINRRWVWRMVSAKHPRTCHRSLRRRCESHSPRCDSDCDKGSFSCEYFHWYPLNPFWFKVIVTAAPYEYPFGEQWELLFESIAVAVVVAPCERGFTEEQLLSEALTFYCVFKSSTGDPLFLWHLITSFSCFWFEGFCE